MKPGVLLEFHLFQNLFQYIKIQLVDLPGIFQIRNKVCRGQETVLGIDPPCQGLLITDPAAHCPDNRLVIYGDPSLPDGTVQVPEDILPLFRILPKFRAVIVKGR